VAPPGEQPPGTDCHFADSAPTPALASTPGEQGGAESGVQAPGGPAQETRGAARGAERGAGESSAAAEEEEGTTAGGSTKSGSDSDHEEPAAGVTRRTTAEAFPSLLLLLPLPIPLRGAAASSHTGSQFFAAASRAILPLKTVRLRPSGPRTETPVQETEKAGRGVPAASLGANQRASTVFFFSFRFFPVFFSFSFFFSFLVSSRAFFCLYPIFLYLSSTHSSFILTFDLGDGGGRERRGAGQGLREESSCGGGGRRRNCRCRRRSISSVVVASASSAAAQPARVIRRRLGHTVDDRLGHEEQGRGGLGGLDAGLKEERKKGSRRFFFPHPIFFPDVVRGEQKKRKEKVTPLRSPAPFGPSFLVFSIRKRRDILPER